MNLCDRKQMRVIRIAMGSPDRMLALMIPLLKKAGSSPHVAVADSVQRFIEDGTLRPGEKILSVRKMAKMSGVNPATVVKAYTVLENRGHLKARPQSGYYVSPRAPYTTREPQLAMPMSTPSYVGVSDLAAQVMTTSTDPANVAFGWGSPSADLFPNRRIGRMLGSIIRDDPNWLGRAALNWVHEPLARAIARRYVNACVHISHAELLITLGCTEALNLCLRAITKPGDTVAVETPSHPVLLQTIQSLGLRVLEIRTDAVTGIDLDALRSALATKRVQALLLMTNFQNPLGYCLSDGKKQKLFELLKEFDIPAVEDDVGGELHFGEERPKPLKAWDTDGRILLCSSFGKTLAPSLRVGWCAPGRYLEPVRRLKLANTMGTPIVLQKTISDFLRIGGYDHHLRAIRRTYRTNLDKFLEVIRRTFPIGTRATQPQGGFIIWVEFPTGVDTERLFRDALKLRINTAPGTIFSSKGAYRNCMRLNSAMQWTDQIAAALEQLGTLAAAQLNVKPRPLHIDKLARTESPARKSPSAR
jgi:DNA-binding transcriptional MocR family regulator